MHAQADDGLCLCTPGAFSSQTPPRLVRESVSASNVGLPALAIPFEAAAVVCAEPEAQTEPLNISNTH